MADHYQLNLGSLRSSITLTLHTHHAARIWQGRTAREGVHSIMGMAGYISVTNLLKHASSQDDPFADWFMLQLEDKLLQEAVRRAGGNLAAAARALGMTRPQLSYRLSRTRDRAPTDNRQ